MTSSEKLLERDVLGHKGGAGTKIEVPLLFLDFKIKRERKCDVVEHMEDPINLNMQLYQRCLHMITSTD